MYIQKYKVSILKGILKSKFIKFALFINFGIQFAIHVFTFIETEYDHPDILFVLLFYIFKSLALITVAFNCLFAFNGNKIYNDSITVLFGLFDLCPMGLNIIKLVIIVCIIGVILIIDVSNAQNENEIKDLIFGLIYIILSIYILYVWAMYFFTLNMKYASKYNRETKTVISYTVKLAALLISYLTFMIIVATKIKGSGLHKTCSENITKEDIIRYMSAFVFLFSQCATMIFLNMAYETVDGSDIQTSFNKNFKICGIDTDIKRLKIIGGLFFQLLLVINFYDIFYSIYFTIINEECIQNNDALFMFSFGYPGLTITVFACMLSLYYDFIVIVGIELSDDTTVSEMASLENGSIFLNNKYIDNNENGKQNNSHLFTPVIRNRLDDTLPRLTDITENSDSKDDTNKASLLHSIREHPELKQND